jgi:hypothetical protein
VKSENDVMTMGNTQLRGGVNCDLQSLVDIMFLREGFYQRKLRML